MAESGTSANWIWASRLGALGGSYLTPDYQPNFDTDAGRQALEIAAQLNECCAPDVGSYGWDEANTAFLNGRVAMMEQWPGLSKLAETPEGFYGKSEVVGKTGYGVPAGVTVNGEDGQELDPGRLGRRDLELRQGPGPGLRDDRLPDRQGG